MQTAKGYKRKYLPLTLSLTPRQSCLTAIHSFRHFLYLNMSVSTLFSVLLLILSFNHIY